MNRRATIAAVVLGLGAAGWYLAGAGAERRDVDPGAGDRTGDAREQTPARIAIQGAQPDPSATAAPAATPVGERRLAPEVVPTVEESPEVPSRARGTIVVRDAAGREFPHEDGVLVVSGEGDLVEVPVRAGAFECDAPPPGEGLQVLWGDPGGLSVMAVELGGRTTLLDERTSLVAGEAHVLTATWPDPVLLRVVSREDGRELDGVDVAGDFARFTYRAHPGPWWEDRAVARDAPSPVTLPAPAQERILRDNPFRTYFVRAPDHAWAPVLLNLTEGGRTTVELVPGGHVTVDCEGVEEERAPSIEISALDTLDEEARSMPAFDPDRTGRVQFRSVAAGTWRVEAVIETPLDARHVVGSAEVSVRAGEESRVHLVLDMPPVALTCPLAGVLVLPFPYKVEEPSVVVRAVTRGVPPELAGVEDTAGFDDAMLTALGRGAPGRVLSGEELVPVPGEARTWSWDAGDVPQGLVELSVPGTGYARRIELASGGDRDVELVCPAPSDVELVLVDVADGAPVVSGASLPILPVGGSLWDVDEYARAERGRGASYRCVLPPGSYLLGLWEGSFAFPFAHFEVTAGATRVEVPVEPTSRLSLKLAHDGASVAPTTQLVDRLEREGGEAVRIGTISMSSADDAMLVGFSAHGRLVLHLNAPAGYLRPDPVTVDVARGGTTDVEVELVPVD